MLPEWHASLSLFLSPPASASVAHTFSAPFRLTNRRADYRSPFKRTPMSDNVRDPQQLFVSLGEGASILREAQRAVHRAADVAGQDIVKYVVCHQQ